MSVVDQLMLLAVRSKELPPESVDDEPGSDL